MVLVRYRSPILYLALGGVYHLGPLFPPCEGVMVHSFRLQFQAARLFHRNFRPLPSPHGSDLLDSFEVAYGNLTLYVPTFLTDFAPLP